MLSSGGQGRLRINVLHGGGYLRHVQRAGDYALDGKRANIAGSDVVVLEFD